MFIFTIKMILENMVVVGCFVFTDQNVMKSVSFEVPLIELASNMLHCPVSLYT
jgi:hypothetical protein